MVPGGGIKPANGDTDLAVTSVGIQAEAEPQEVVSSAFAQLEAQTRADLNQPVIHSIRPNVSAVARLDPERHRAARRIQVLGRVEVKLSRRAGDHHRATVTTVVAGLVSLPAEALHQCGELGALQFRIIERGNER